ncbi:MAG: hypothetical protein ACOYKM_07320 [Caulobacterales bacterium]
MPSVSAEELIRLRAELSDLAQMMRDVSQDGRALAAELANTINALVSLQGFAIEDRLKAVINRLDQINRNVA